MSKYKTRRGIRYELDRTIVFFVRRKKPPVFVPKDFLIPPKIKIGNIEYITDVVEIGSISTEVTVSRGTQTKMFRPVVGGVSAAAATGTACTLTGPFQKDDVVYFLTCSHCTGRIDYSCEISYTQGNPILQPSPFDGGKIEHVIGRVIWASNVIGETDLDIAYIFPEAYINYSTEIAALGIYFNGKIDKLSTNSIGITLYKSGRSTGFTSGKLIGLNGVIKVNYGACGFTIVRDVIVLEKMMERGDSGSPLFSLDGTFYGVLFAVTDIYSFAIPAEKIAKLGFKPLSTPPKRLGGISFKVS